MPDATMKQRRAMFAAKAGNSTLGIPKSVGKEFIAADKASGKFQGKGRMESMAGKARGSAEMSGQGIRAGGRMPPSSKR